MPSPDILTQPVADLHMGARGVRPPLQKKSRPTCQLQTRSLTMTESMIYLRKVT